jgi:hypothetical protein
MVCCTSVCQLSIQELRQLAVIELQINADLCLPLYTIEENELRLQAPTYELFVERTWHVTEWANELSRVRDG